MQHTTGSPPIHVSDIQASKHEPLAVVQPYAHVVAASAGLRIGDVGLQGLSLLLEVCHQAIELALLGLEPFLCIRPEVHDGGGAVLVPFLQLLQHLPPEVFNVAGQMLPSLDDTGMVGLQLLVLRLQGVVALL